jgi:hypothetical protein
MKIIITVIMLLSFFTVHSQNLKYKWEDGVCEFESTYNSKLYTKQQIKNCERLALYLFFRIEKTPSVFKPGDIARLNLDSLNKEYEDKKKILTELDLPRNKDWDDARAKALYEVEQIHYLSKIVYQSFDNPQVFKDFKAQDSTFKQHTQALLKGGDLLLKDWYELTIKQAEKNALPSKVWAKYYEQSKSNNKLLYARIEVTTFGWWNCAIVYAGFVDSEMMQKTFKKLFVKIRTIECEDVD